VASAQTQSSQIFQDKFQKIQQHFTMYNDILSELTNDTSKYEESPTGFRSDLTKSSSCHYFPIAVLIAHTQEINRNMHRVACLWNFPLYYVG